MLQALIVTVGAGYCGFMLWLMGAAVWRDYRELNPPKKQ